MKQAYYQVENQGMELTASTPGLDEAARNLVKKTGGYVPAPNTTPTTDDRRFALFNDGSGLRILLQAVPVVGGRGGFSFTHSLIVEPEEKIPTVDLLRSWGDRFWATANGASTRLDAVDARKLPWVARKEQLDTKLTEWAKGQGRKAVVAAVLCAVLAPGARKPTVYLGADPTDVFWAAYGAARLLPNAAAEQLTFSTYEEPITSRDARLVGGRPILGASPPAQCQTSPNVWIDLTAPGRPDVPTLPGAYANAVFPLWLDSRQQVDDVLEKAAHLSDPDKLDIWLRIECKPNTVTDHELALISDDPFWQAQIAGSPTLLRRILTANPAKASLLIQRANKQVQTNLTQLIATDISNAIREKNSADVSNYLQQTHAFPDSMTKQVAKAVADGSPAADRETWLLLAKWLGPNQMGAAVLNAPAVVSEAIAIAGPDFHEHIAEWLVCPDRQLTDAGYPVLISNTGLWEVVRKRLKRPDANPVVVGFLSSLLGILEQKHATAARLADLLANLIASHPDRAEELAIAVERTPILLPYPGLLLALAASKVKLATKLSERFRSRLARSVLSDKDGRAISNEALRRTLLEIQPGPSGLSGNDAERWTALRELPQLDKIQPEEANRILDPLIAWNAGQVFDPKRRSPESQTPVSLVLQRVCSAASGAAPASLNSLRTWYGKLCPNWQKAGRSFWTDFLSALTGWADERGRRKAMIQAVWLANEVKDLQEETETWLANLPDADRDVVGADIRDKLSKNYVNRLIIEGPLKQKPTKTTSSWVSWFSSWFSD